MHQNDVRQTCYLPPVLELTRDASGLVLADRYGHFVHHQVLALRKALRKSHITQSQLWYFMDTNRSNTVTYGEMQRGLLHASIHWSATEVRELFDEFDPDNRGHIRYDRMVELLQVARGAE